MVNHMTPSAVSSQLLLPSGEAAGLQDNEPFEDLLSMLNVDTVSSSVSDTCRSRRTGDAVQVCQDQPYEYVLQGGGVLRIRADSTKGLSYQLWPSSLALARYVETLQEAASGGDGGRSWRGCKVLELGAGTGLVSLVLASLGADVVATDLPEVVTGLLSRNLQAHETWVQEHGGRAVAAPLTWGVTSPQSFPEVQVVVAADLIYRRHLFEPLLTCLLGLDPTVEILIAHVRRWNTDAHFFKRAGRYFDIELVMLTSDASARICEHPRVSPFCLPKGSQAILRLRRSTKEGPKKQP